MSEPTLDKIEDYDTLKGEKKKVVWAVVLAGLLMGIVYTIIYSNNNDVEDRIKTEQNIKTIPVK